MVKAAVIGGGVFGCTIAVDLARAGWAVDLYEQATDFVTGTTARCQARLHSGYHYPRSDKTAIAARDAAPIFAARYPGAIRTADQHYVIAANSKVSADEYLAFCDRLDLQYKIVEPLQVHGAQVCVQVPEAYVDVDKLRRLIRRDLSLAGVQVHLATKMNAPVFGHDITVVATYGHPWSKPLRYELCEIAVMEIGRYDNQSFVVMYGDHVSLDSFGRLHMLYDVVHSVHAVNEIPDEYQDLLARCAYGPIKTPLSHYSRMLQTAGQHLGMLQEHGQNVVIYHGSLFSVRAVLPNVDDTDERPTLVERDGNVVSVLSGKICTAVDAAREVVAIA